MRIHNWDEKYATASLGLYATVRVFVYGSERSLAHSNLIIMVISPIRAAGAGCRSDWLVLLSLCETLTNGAALTSLRRLIAVRRWTTNVSMIDVFCDGISNINIQSAYLELSDCAELKYLTQQGSAETILYRLARNRQRRPQTRSPTHHRIHTYTYTYIFG